MSKFKYLLAVFTLLVVVSLPGFAQSVTNNGVTITPTSAPSIAAGVRFRATGPNWLVGWTRLPGEIRSFYTVYVLWNGGSAQGSVVYVDSFMVDAFVPINVPPFSAIRIKGPFLDITVEIGAPTPVAAPSLQAQGLLDDFLTPVFERWNGVITFKSLVSVIDLAIYGGGFGGAQGWQLRFEGPVTVEVPVTAVPGSQVTEGFESLQGKVGLLPTGLYSVAAYLTSNPSVRSAARQVQVQSPVVAQ